MGKHAHAKCRYFEIDDRRAVVGETVFIPGHPVGRAKQFALEDTWPTSGGTNGRCAVLGVGGDSCGYSTAYQSIQYTCDTLGSFEFCLELHFPNSYGSSHNSLH